MRRSVLALFLLTVAVAGLLLTPLPLSTAASGPTPEDEWPQFGYSAAHGNFNPAEAILDPTNVGSLEEKWSRGVGDRFGSAPVLADGRVFVSANRLLSAFDADTGSVLWSVKLGARDLRQPSVDGSTLYVTGAQSVFAFEAATGVLLWKSNLESGQLFWPAVAGEGLVVTLAQPSDVVAMDASSGSVKWRSTREQPVELPAVSGGLVFVVENYDTVTALDAETGEVVWTHTESANHRPIDSGPAIAGSTGYAASSAMAFAFDAPTGEGVWYSGHADFAVSLAVDTANGILYVGQVRHNGSVSAYDADAGATCGGPPSSRPRSS